ncbi:MAG: hypothetical protein JSS83_15960 [Cyanobacteria bacterium SZAS LIN-3]|nr:hypothetical protein [Cyanobacteria bacterium SZAS LIN-3]
MDHSSASCDCCERKTMNSQIKEALEACEAELVEAALRIVQGASDPFSGVIKFLQERPEGATLHGYLVTRVLLQTFGSMDEVPALIRALTSHVHEVQRKSNVISIRNEHPTAERWGSYTIKLKEKTSFEIGFEKNCLVLKNIVGCFGSEHGIDAPLEKIMVRSPRELVVTVNMGLLHPQRVLEI